MKEFLNFSENTNFISFVVMIITAVMFMTASYCDNILGILFYILGYTGMDVYAYMMYKSNKNKQIWK